MSENNLALAVQRATGTYILEVFNSYNGVCGRFDARTMRFLLREQEDENDELVRQLDKAIGHRAESVVPRRCKHRQYLGHLITGDAAEQIFTMNVVEDTRASRRKRYTSQIEANSNGIGWVLRMWQKPDLLAVPESVTRQSSTRVLDRFKSIFAGLCSCCTDEAIFLESDKENSEQTALLRRRQRADSTVHRQRLSSFDTKGIPDRVFLLLPLSEIKRHVETTGRKEKEMREKTRSLRMKNIPQHLHEQLY